MAVRTPLVLVSGQLQQLQAGDSIATGPAVVTYTTVVKDLGVSNRTGSFDITGLSGLTIDKFVDVRQTAGKISSKGDARDEPEMDVISATGYVVDATTIRVFWNATGVVVGSYEFAYLVSG